MNLHDDFEEDFGVVVSVWVIVNVCKETGKPLFSSKWTWGQGQRRKTFSVDAPQLTPSDILFGIPQAFQHIGIICCWCCIPHILKLIIFHVFTCCRNCNRWWSCQMFSVRNGTNECSSRLMSGCCTRFSASSASSSWVIVAKSTLSAVISIANCKSGKISKHIDTYSNLAFLPIATTIKHYPYKKYHLDFFLFL